MIGNQYVTSMMKSKTFGKSAWNHFQDSIMNSSRSLLYLGTTICPLSMSKSTLLRNLSTMVLKTVYQTRTYSSFRRHPTVTPFTTQTKGWFTTNTTSTAGTRCSSRETLMKLLSVLGKYLTHNWSQIMPGSDSCCPSPSSKKNQALQSYEKIRNKKGEKDFTRSKSRW